MTSMKLAVSIFALAAAGGDRERERREGRQAEGSEGAVTTAVFHGGLV